MVFGWLGALAVIATAVFLPWDQNNPDTDRWTTIGIITADTLQRPMFALGIFWIIFACCTGYGGEYNGPPVYARFREFRNIGQANPISKI